MWEPFGSAPANETAFWRSGRDERGTLNILSACIITLLLCAYNSLHLDIPQYGKVGWQHQIWRRTLWVLVGLGTPEFVAFIAFRQWLFARNLEYKMDDILTHLLPGSRSLVSPGDVENVPSLPERRQSDSDIPLIGAESGSITSVRQNILSERVHPWTRIHSHFALMGGFVFDTSKMTDNIAGSDCVRQTLTPVALRKLAANAPSLLPDISKETIRDKSKTNSLADFLVCVQTCWFIAQTIGRLATELPISLLEMNTLLHAFCWLLIYLTWWHKPLDIDEPYLIDASGDLARKVCAWMMEKDAQDGHLQAHRSSSDGSSDIGCSNELRLLYEDDLEDESTNNPIKTRAETRKLVVKSKEYNRHRGRVQEINPVDYNLQWIPETSKSTGNGRLRLYPGQTVHGFVLFDASEDSIKTDKTRDVYAFVPFIRIERLKLAQSLRTKHGPADMWNFDKEEGKFLTKGTSIVASPDQALKQWMRSAWLSPNFVLLSGLLLAGSLYGGIYLFVWNGPFLTITQGLLWQISCLVIVSPLGLIILCVPLAVIAFIVTVIAMVINKCIPSSAMLTWLWSPINRFYNSELNEVIIGFLMIIAFPFYIFYAARTTSTGLKGDDSTPPGSLHGQTPSTASGTTYSVDSAPGNLDMEYVRAFAQQLAQDLETASGLKSLLNVPPFYISEVLRVFTWKLHEESTNPFQWAVSVALHRKREVIIAELMGTIEWLHGTSVSVANPSLPVESMPEGPFDMLDEDEEYYPQLPVEEHLPRLPDYRTFVRPSESYRWLVSKICQHERLSFGSCDSTSEIGSKIRDELRVQEPLRRMSHRRPLSKAQLDFVLPWNPRRYVKDIGLNCSLSKLLDSTLCLTGSWCEAQAMTVTGYIRQTWPTNGEIVIRLFEELLHLPDSQECTYYAPGNHGPRLTARLSSPDSCVVSVAAGAYYVSEVAEQLAWLAATLQPSLQDYSTVIRYPRIDNLSVVASMSESSTAEVSGVCTITFEIAEKNGKNEEGGFCWGSLFGNAVLVGGYPILRRSHPKTGLEMSLSIMAYLVRSEQVVQCEERIIMKGFSSLLIATLVTSSVVLWHLFVSKEPGERISYFDTRIDALDLAQTNGHSLRSLETTRHIVGWCANADEFCGHKLAEQKILGSQLQHTPASIMIDRLYLEGGMNVIGGLTMRVNQKQEPTQLMRDLDYPSLLKWVAVQAMVFFDSSERRAWLVDGASALLHLVRNSLHRDEHDEDSPYEWVFDESKLKDTWPGCTTRQSALKTLKNSDNLNLRLYVKERSDRDGQITENFATLRERVVKILHSLEILIETQVRAASKGEIKTLQTLDRRKFITGYDILDVVEPLGPVSTRIAHFDTWGDGWMDLLPSISATTFFGEGYGELIRPKDSASVCTHWKTVPARKDYMCASVSTLKMLHEKRLRRLGSTSNVGEFTSKLLWTSTCQPFQTCQCLVGQSMSEQEHLDPRQFLVSSKQGWKSTLMPKGSAPIDIDTLKETGAVVFANSGFLGRKVSGRADGKVDEGAGTQPLNSLTSQSIASIPAADSGTTHSTNMTTETTTSTNTTILEPTSSAGKDVEDVAESNDKGKGKGKMKRMMGVFTKG